MATSNRGTFVISWVQTEIDGVGAAPIELLNVGATWRWHGQAVRVDSVAGPLVLDGAEGTGEMRKRASKVVRRLIGAAVSGHAFSPVDDEAEDELPEQSFLITDGHKTWAVTLLPVPETGARLLMVMGDLPPMNHDLWVVRVTVEKPRAAVQASDARGIICFAQGTRLATEYGPRLVEELCVGDRIVTRDNGPQEILWRGSRRISGARLHVMPQLRPIRFRTDVFGHNRPDGDLLVSPHHRMLVRGRTARALFNSDEVMVKALDLVNDHTITVDHDIRDVTYTHLLLDRHNVIWANGLETESFHPAACDLETVEEAQLRALYDTVPRLEFDPEAYGDFARRCLTTSEAAIMRHDLVA